MAMSLYEAMSRNSDSYPMFIPYVDGLPNSLRRPIFKLFDGDLEENARGQVLLRPFFEKVKSSILTRDYGDYASNHSMQPEIAANRCLALKNLINVCK